MAVINQQESSHHVNKAVQAVRQILSPEDLGRLFWLSGSTCAGKTTVSSAVSERLNWGVYHCDKWRDNQRQRADPNKHPNWYSYSHLTGDSLWLQPVEQHLLQQARAFDEQIELIAEDLSATLKTTTGPLIYDGFISPRILTQLLPGAAHAFYLVAAEPFQRHYYEQRPWIKDVLSKTTDPSRAWQNWMTRDVEAARSLERMLSHTNLEWALVDGSNSVEQAVDRICSHFRTSAAI